MVWGCIELVPLDVLPEAVHAENNHKGVVTSALHTFARFMRTIKKSQLIEVLVASSEYSFGKPVRRFYF
jgi:hypothetical protein